jgi:protein TonB
MSGPVPAAASPPRRARVHDAPLFVDLVASDPRPWRAGRSGVVSLLTHTLIAALIVILPIVWPEAMPPMEKDYITALIYNPPPPPPPPLPRGSAVAPRKERAEPTTDKRDIKASRETLTAPIRIPPKLPTGENKLETLDQFGSDTGDEFGVPEGNEYGVPGGVVGGIPGGVLGGVIGGTGDGPPVLDYDQPPRLIKQVKPAYPQEAFVKKVEGTVLVEILIDTTGRVARARILQSIPLLDQAALQCVYQWRFSPAIKRGIPVPTVAPAPVSFRIY